MASGPRPLAEVAVAAAFARDVRCVLGLPFDAVDEDEALRTVRRAVAERRRLVLSTPNLNFLVGAHGDAALRDSVLQSDLSVADGMPVVWASRLLGAPLPARVAGASLLERLGEPGGKPVSIYFFGGPEGAAERACRRLNAGGGPATCVGYESPGYGSVESLSDEASIARINASGADVLVVSLAARKGQAWILRNRDRLTVPVLCSLGAALNFAAGTLRRAPPWMQRAGLEWLWRIREEPALWRRYAGDGAAFLRLLAMRVLPLAGLERRRPPSAALGRATITERDAPGERVIALHGAWARGNLAPLRACLARQADARLPLRLDLSGVTHADSAFLGLLAVLHGRRARRGLACACAPVSGVVRRLARYACADFLLAPPGGRHG